MALDFAVADRQTFGSSVNREAVARLLGGELVMSPHPAWRLPETIDWAADPFGDVNWRSQFHMLRWLDPLRRAARAGDDAAFALWLRWARDWVHSNPRSAPAHEWVWSDMVDGIRAIQLCLAAPLLRDRSPEDLDWLEETIRDHAEHLADPANLGHSNHALHQHEALFVCGRILGDEQIAELARSRFDELLAAQYDEQGMNAEGAVAYHYNNYLWYERALKRFDAEGFERPPAAARHALAPEGIAHATRPDGTFVGIGDTDGGSPRRVGAPVTDYVSSGGAEGEPPADLLKIYDQGYVFARSGWGETERNYDEETFFSVSFGRADRVHGHPDGGSLTYSADTVNWIVDPGKFQYGRSIARRHMLSRAAHSLVSIVDATPRKGATVELLRSTRTENAYDLLFRDDSFEDIALTRRVIYSQSGDYLVVVDHVVAPLPVTAHQRWQLGPGVTSVLGRHRVDLSHGGRRAVLAFSGTYTELAQVTGSDDPFDGWVSTGWKQKVPATAVTASKRGENIRFITVLATGEGTAPSIRAVPTEERGFRLEVTTGRVTEVIHVGNETVHFPQDSEDEHGTEGAARPVVAATASGRPHALDPGSRREVFERIAGARAEAWSAAAGGGASAEARSEERLRLARDLLDAGRSRGLVGDVDLGITAAVADLRGTIRGRVNPRKVQPHRTALVNWERDDSWRPTFYPLPVRHHGDRFSLGTRPETAAIHTLAVGPLVLPMALHPSPGRVLTVLLHGAIDRARHRLPIFQRWRFQLELDAGPTIAFADPTLDLADSVRLAWYLGTETAPLIPAMAEMVRTTAATLGAEHVVLSGSSGGGFAALQLGALIPGAVVAAMSPQTDLRHYSRRLVYAAVAPALGLPDAAAVGADPGRLSVLEAFRAQGAYPRVELLSNSGDAVHVTRHEGPLRELYREAGQGDALRTTTVDLGPGHRAADNESYGRFLGAVYESL